MAIVLIGGKNIEVPALNIRRIKRVWPFVDQSRSGAEEDIVSALDLAVNVVAVAVEASPHPDIVALVEKAKADGVSLHPLVVDYIEDNLIGPEMGALRGAMRSILTEGGIMSAPSAEGKAAGESSTETLTE